MNKKTVRHIIEIAVMAVITVALIVVFKPRIKPPLPSSDSKNATETGSAYVPPETDVTESAEAVQTETEEPDNSISTREFLGNIVFIGDRSIGKMAETAAAALQLPSNERQIWSYKQNISAARAVTIDDFIYPKTGENQSFLDAVNDAKPRYIILTFGSYWDGDKELTKESFNKTYGEFIRNLREVSNSSQIIIQSILPVGRNCNVVDAAAVAERNVWLKELSENYNLIYLDSWSSLTDDEGYLDQRYCEKEIMADGYENYYLNNDGYTVLLNYIRDNLPTLLGIEVKD